jgi:methionyl-tRNA synthetase
MNWKFMSPDAPPPQPPFPEPGDPPPEEKTPEPELLSIEEFARLDLRVARIVGAEMHPKADRLLKLRVDVGGEERQLVAGIAAFYKPEDLVGRTIIVVANLKPAKLRGEISQGMLLAASSGDVVSLLTTDQEMPPGASIH